MIIINRLMLFNILAFSCCAMDQREEKPMSQRKVPAVKVVFPQKGDQVVIPPYTVEELPKDHQQPKVTLPTALLDELAKLRQLYHKDKGQ